MTGAQLAIAQVVLHTAGKFQKTDGIRHRRAVLAHALGDVFLLESEFLAEAHIGLRFFQGIEAFTLKVLNERHFQHVLVRRGAHDDRHLGQTEFTARTEAALTGDELMLAMD